MAEFRIKLITVAGALAMFAGMAHAQNQLSCTAATATTSAFVRAESNDDQVGDVTLSCTGGANGSNAATVNLQVYMSPSVNITSATLGTGSHAVNETEAGLSANFATNTALVNGTVAANSVTFSGIAVGALAANATTTITVTNIKIQASSIGASTGVPTAVNESVFVSGTNVNNNVLTANNVAFVTNGLTSVKAGGPGNNNTVSNNAICNQITAANQNFTVSFAEAFATAFKTQGSNTTNTALNSWFTNNTETGFGVAGNSTTNTATAGTRVTIAFANVPANVNVYMPLTIVDSVNNVGNMQMVTSATAAKTLVTAASTSGNNAPAANYGQVAISGGSGTAVYEYTVNDPATIEKYTANVDLQASAGAVAAPSGAITATVSFAPIGASSNVPNFVSGSSTTTVNGSNFTACSTTLLFPFVTNQLGFDTGLAISNTSNDLLASSGTKSQAANASGTCALTFFGNTAPSPVTTATIATGTTYAAAASTVAPGFQGYMIANCNFLYGHGFAYVVYNLTQNNGAAMGYLADVLTSDRKSLTTTGTVSGTIANGAGTVTGSVSTTSVSSTNPEE